MESNTENRHHKTQSDADSQTSQCDSFYSPLRYESPFRSDDPDDTSSPAATKPPSPGFFSVSKYLSPLRYTNHQQKPTTQKSELISFPLPPPPPPMFASSVNEAAEAAATETATARRTQKLPRLNGRPGPGVLLGSAGAGSTGTGEDLEGCIIDKRRSERPSATKSRPGVDFGGSGSGGDQDLEGSVTDKRRQGGRAMTTTVASASPRKGSGRMAKKMELWFRVLEIIGCVISFSIMASDKNQGWTGDSFDRYKEYRYCVAVNIAGFAYATFQACCSAYKLVAEKHSFLFGCYFDFAMDQTLAYLLMSASSAAATRVDDWISNWGKDQFTEKATASITTSFMAFALFAVSSLISGYNLCSHS